MALNLDELRKTANDKSRFNAFIIDETIFTEGEGGFANMERDDAGILIQQIRKINSFIEQGNTEAVELFLEGFLEGIRFAGTGHDNDMLHIFEKHVRKSIAEMKGIPHEDAQGAIKNFLARQEEVLNK